MHSPSLAELSGRTTELATRSLYDRLFSFLDRHPTLRLVRIWNYLPAINRAAEDADGCRNIYQFFNRGRYAAFAARYGGDRETWPVPAASAVGCAGQRLAIEFFATTSDPILIENLAAQVPARCYSAQYGPLPPLFARGALFFSAGRWWAITSGTASITGEQSKHGNTLDPQLDLSIRNLRYLVAAENLERYGINLEFTLENLRLLRVYHRYASDVDWIRNRLLHHGINCPVSFFNADICRSELVVEIEGIFIGPQQQT